jgi:lipoprotein-releasing system permease protein
MYRWVIAWRWLKSLPMLWVSVVGVCLGVASILVVDSIFNGVLRELRTVYKGTASDLYIPTVPPRSARDAVVPIDAVVQAIRGCPGVAGAAVRLSWPCLLPESLRLKDIVAIGAISRRSLLDVRGIVPDEEAGATDLRSYLAAAATPPERRVRDVARPFDVADLPDVARSSIPILLGDRAASDLGLKRGATFTLFTFPDGVTQQQALQQGVEPRERSCVLAGTFATGFYLEDMTRALMRIEDLQKFTETTKSSSEIVVKLAAGADLETVREALRTRLEEFEFARWFNEPVLTWAELNLPILAAISNQRHVLDLILFFVVIVAGFNLLVSLNLIVTEKLRDVGTLAALGASSFGIASVFTALGFLVTLLGSALGLVGGVFLASHVNDVHDWIAGLVGHRLWESSTYLFDRIPTDVAPGMIGLGVAATFAVTLLFAFVASLRAARLDPVVALRHE